jgi:fatty acid desaturase
MLGIQNVTDAQGSGSLMTPVVQKRVTVRAPFRVLGGFFCLAALIALLRTGYLAWDGRHALHVKDVVVLPGVLWLFRLVSHATVHGDLPSDGNWPFASFQVAFGYFLFVMAFQSWL